MVDVTLPSLGESVTEGIITQWFKKVGDAVARDEPLFEVSTDKVDSEMPSPAAGVLVQILADEGDTVQTGARVAVIDERAVAGSAPSPSIASPPSGEPTLAASEPTIPAGPSAPASGEGVNGVVVSPVVRRILSDGGVEPSTIRGSGPGGSITRRGMAKKKGGIGQHVVKNVKRTFLANLQNVRVQTDTGVHTIKACTRCIRARRIVKA